MSCVCKCQPEAGYSSIQLKEELFHLWFARGPVCRSKLGPLKTSWFNMAWRKHCIEENPYSLILFQPFRFLHNAAQAVWLLDSLRGALCEGYYNFPSILLVQLTSIQSILDTQAYKGVNVQTSICSWKGPKRFDENNSVTEWFVHTEFFTNIDVLHKKIIIHSIFKLCNHSCPGVDWQILPLYAIDHSPPFTQSHITFSIHSQSWNQKDALTTEPPPLSSQC